MFGLHYWGECFELTKDQIKEATNESEKPGDCTLADGLYKTKCNKMDTDYPYECVGDKSYYVYKLKST